VAHRVTSGGNLGTARILSVETSLHPDLLPALSRLIIKAAETTQVWVVTHSAALIAALGQSPETRVIELQKELAQTQVKGQNLLDRPQWRWVE
jgi:predicted ATPase